MATPKIVAVNKADDFKNRSASPAPPTRREIQRADLGRDTHKDLPATVRAGASGQLEVVSARERMKLLDELREETRSLEPHRHAADEFSWVAILNCYLFLGRR